MGCIFGEIRQPADGQRSPADRTAYALLGLAFAPDFETSHYIYLHYSPPEPAVNRVSRFMMTGDKINMESEVILLEIPVQRQTCCHAGGDLAFDSNGNLYIATGDNTDHINNYAALKNSIWLFYERNKRDNLVNFHGFFPLLI